MSGWDSVISIINTAVQFMLVMTILVTVHELGHYLFAKWVGMEVEAFAVMMGGVRKTDLGPLLARPVTPSRIIWGLAILGMIVTSVGAGIKSALVTDAGLIIAGVIAPLLAARNSARLYHLPEATPYLRWVMAFGAGVLMLMVATGSANSLRPEMVIGLAVAAAVFAMFSVYYSPLASGSEEEQGLGSVMVRGDYVPVQFRPVWHRTVNGTEFSLLLLPLGGFARIKGMHPKEDGSEVQIPGGFYSKHPWARLAALFGGPLFSVLFGIVVLATLFSAVGMRKGDERAIVGVATSDKPAAQAGIKPGDKIVSIAGESVAKFEDIRRIVSDQPAGPLAVVVERSGEQLTFTVTPEVDRQPKLDKEGNAVPNEFEERPILGVAPATIYERLPVGAAIAEAASFPVEFVRSLAATFQKPETAKDAIGGPVTMAQMTHEASQGGLYQVLLLAALLSITLGVMNLLPVPPLDGGQIMINFMELFTRGKRLSIGFQRAVSSVGFVLILLLMVSAATLDLGRVAQKAESSNTPKSNAP